MSLPSNSPPEKENQTCSEKSEAVVELETKSPHIEQWFHNNALLLFETLRKEARYCEQTK